MDLPRHNKEQIDDVQFFLDFAFTERKTQGGKISCPCVICANGKWEKRDIVYSHLICHGFVEGYKEWVIHGKGDGDIHDEDNYYDNTNKLLNDIFRDAAQAKGVYQGPNEYAKNFFNLVEEAKQEFYLDCKNFSTFSFTIWLYLLKCLHGWSNTSFTAFLKLLKEAMPHLNILLSYNKTKAMIKDLGLDYKKIYAYPNDCMLYWMENEKDKSYYKCGASQWNEYS